MNPILLDPIIIQDSEGNAISPLTDEQLRATPVPVNTAGYGTNAIDDYTTASVTYICKEASSGAWLFTKIDETGNFATFTYASETNNPTMTSYALAYADRDNLTYGLYSEI